MKIRTGEIVKPFMGGEEWIEVFPDARNQKLIFALQDLDPADRTYSRQSFLLGASPLLVRKEVFDRLFA